MYFKKDFIFISSQIGQPVPILMGALCAMSVTHSPLGSAFNLLPTGASLRDLRDSFLVDIHSSDLNAVPWTGLTLARPSCPPAPSCRIRTE